MHLNSVMYKIVCIVDSVPFYTFDSIHKRNLWNFFSWSTSTKFISSIDCVHITPDTRNV